MLLVYWRKLLFMNFATRLVSVPWTRIEGLLKKLLDSIDAVRRFPDTPFYSPPVLLDLFYSLYLDGLIYPTRPFDKSPEDPAFGVQ
jgi:hypothetical protein